MWLLVAIAATAVLVIAAAFLIDRRDIRAGRRPGSNPEMDGTVRDEKRDLRAMNPITNMILDDAWTDAHRQGRR